MEIEEELLMNLELSHISLKVFRNTYEGGVDLHLSVKYKDLFDIIPNENIFIQFPTEEIPVKDLYISSGRQVILPSRNAGEYNRVFNHRSDNNNLNQLHEDFEGYLYICFELEKYIRNNSIEEEESFL